ncbi:hypothetical protein [Kitasatospora sp. NPDC004531]
MTDPVNDPATTGSPDAPSTTLARAGVEDLLGDLPALGLGAAPPHPKPVSLVGSYVYSYDLAPTGRPSPSPAGRSIPNMRPSYDAEHPVSATPIYDSLYSEYRRMFRALPGDRSGEEGLRFTGFAVRDQHPRDQHPRDQLQREQHPRDPQLRDPQLRDQHPPREMAAERREPAPYPQHHSFEAYAAPAPAAPQFVPSPGSAAQANGQGWVASGYLGPPPQAPAPAPPAQAPVPPGAGAAAGPAGGRHRSVLSLPPGRDA